VDAPVFYYDTNSPYAYLAAHRVDDVLPERPDWRPVAFGVIVRERGKLPWSFAEDRTADFEEIARRARERGLPEVRYPEEWPRDGYSLAPLRALLLADDQDQLRALSLELFRTMFVEGRMLNDLDTLLDAAARAGMDRDTVRDGIEDPSIKARLRANTDAALEAGVTGVPTVAVAGELFWGDDRLEDAAAAFSPS
jgi:2-hydroxychromene-2-carboxylate isomerase